LAVLIVDKASFPRAKVCGGCLDALALGTLKAVGLGELVDRGGAIPLYRLQLAIDKRQITFPIFESAALSRETLDSALLSTAIRAGAHFLPGTTARLGQAAVLTRQVFFCRSSTELSAEARVVLVANGLGSKLVSREMGCRTVFRAHSYLGAGSLMTKFPASYRTGTIYMACGAGGYVGLVQVEDGTLNVAAALNPLFVKECKGLGEAAQAILQTAGFPGVPQLAAVAWRGTPLLSCSTRPVAYHRVFVVGDAAGYVEPFTGEGIGWALASAAAVAPLARRACRQWSAALIDEWSALHRRTVGTRQQICRYLTRALRYPRLARVLLAPSARWPRLAGMLAHLLQPRPNGPLLICRSGRSEFAVTRKIYR
jgi:flavin-dependent dehydrogenase